VQKKKTGCLTYIATGFVLIAGYFVVGSLFNDNSGTLSKTSNSRQEQTASQEQTSIAREVINKDLHIVGKVYAVKSEHHSNAFYVAAKVAGPGIETGVACLWLMSGTKTSPKLIINANGGAKNFSPGLPWGPNTKAKASFTDKEAGALVRWVENNVN